MLVMRPAAMPRSAMPSQMPGAKIWAAEPEGFDDTIRSLENGQIQSVDPSSRSICDAIVTPSPGEITFGINRRTLAGGFAVSDVARIVTPGEAQQGIADYAAHMSAGKTLIRFSDADLGVMPSA